MRILSTSLIALSFLAAPAFASAHEVKSKPDIDLSISDLKLPSEAEIDKIMDQMPDLNALMDGFLAIAQDEDLHKSLEDAGDKLSTKMEKLSDIETRDNGMPDLNLLMETMLKTFSDDDVMGEMLGVVGELQKSVEENIDVEMLKPKN